MPWIHYKGIILGECSRTIGMCGFVPQVRQSTVCIVVTKLWKFVDGTGSVKTKVSSKKKKKNGMSKQFFGMISGLRTSVVSKSILGDLGKFNMMRKTCDWFQKVSCWFGILTMMQSSLATFLLVSSLTHCRLDNISVTLLVPLKSMHMSHKSGCSPPSGWPNAPYSYR